jgi:hypothetical protein
MAPSASSVTSVRLETGREQLPVSPAPALTEQPTATRHNRLRALEVAECSLCGIALPLGLLVPDGGQACADIRWYCKDAMSCTKRWTAARAPGRVPTPTARGGAFAGTGQVAPDGAPAEQPGGWFEEAKSAV